MAAPTPRDWRAEILSRLPEPARTRKMATHDALDELIAVAAHDRRMTEADYIMRAARAFVAYDLGLDVAALGEAEPPISNVLARNVKRRLRGRGFGQWRITGLGDV